jgi:hypothetical protein
LNLIKDFTNARILIWNNWFNGIMDKNSSQKVTQKENSLIETEMWSRRIGNSSRNLAYLDKSPSKFLSKKYLNYNKKLIKKN